MGEYVLTFFLIIAVMSAMTIFLKRTLHGRIRDAKEAMGDIVTTRASGQWVGNFYIEYEPYYLNSVAGVNRAMVSRQVLSASPGDSSGIFSQTFNEATRTRAVSETAPPQLAD